MRLLNKDVGEGFLHLQLDTLDDLWALRNLIAPGDLVTADTQRTAESTGDKLREAKMEKRRMRLGVRAESVEWHDFDDHLRVLGPIQTGPQDHGRHHTLILRADGMDVHIGLSAPASPPAGPPPAGGGGTGGAGADAAKVAFYDEALKSLQAFRPDPKVPCLVVGPGWWREEFLEHVRRKAPAAAQGLATEGTAHGGRTGIHEAVRNGLVERVARDHRVGKETALVEELLTRIARGDGTAAYGAGQVRRAVEAGAVEHLLASDAAVRTGMHEELLRLAEAARATIVVVARRPAPGPRRLRMGGLAARLRYAIPDLM